jgi:uncharacterized repeat protein (TIGR03803 family)
MSGAIARLTLAILAGTAIVTSSPASASSYSVIYSFAGGSDGSTPAAGLLNVPGTVGSKLYGTTVFGGSGCATCGTVFAVDPATGTKTTVHDFNGTDGWQPSAALISLNGLLYGTTGFGGSACGGMGCGTVYSIVPSTNAENVVYSFGASPDGAAPFASVLNVGGTLYGTTQVGGTGTACNDNCGTVFSLTTGGSESVLHSFLGATSDGAYSIAGLTSYNGLLYGTTLRGGTADSGTVFSIDTSGNESVVYSFQGGSSDGAQPYAGLIVVGNRLYGATNTGGGTGCGGSGCGVLFKINPSTGNETVVHTFTGPDGANPQGSLLDVGGLLYGTTIEGGVSVTGSTYGTIYSFDPSTGTETVLHTFGSSSSDGRHPRTTLINVGGTLYGTTEGGGSAGNGTVFAYTP